MNPHRPRPPRRGSAALRYLRYWRQRVEDAEIIARAGVQRGEFTAGTVDWAAELHDRRDDAIEVLSALT